MQRNSSAQPDTSSASLREQLAHEIVRIDRSARAKRAFTRQVYENDTKTDYSQKTCLADAKQQVEVFLSALSEQTAFAEHIIDTPKNSAYERLLRRHLLKRSCHHCGLSVKRDQKRCPHCRRKPFNGDATPKQYPCTQCCMAFIEDATYPLEHINGKNIPYWYLCCAVAPSEEWLWSTCHHVSRSWGSTTVCIDTAVVYCYGCSFPSCERHAFGKNSDVDIFICGNCYYHPHSRPPSPREILRCDHLLEAYGYLHEDFLRRRLDPMLRATKDAYLKTIRALRKTVNEIDFHRNPASLPDHTEEEACDIVRYTYTTWVQNVTDNVALKKTILSSINGSTNPNDGLWLQCRARTKTGALCKNAAVSYCYDCSKPLCANDISREWDDPPRPLMTFCSKCKPDLEPVLNTTPDSMVRKIALRLHERLTDYTASNTQSFESIMDACLTPSERQQDLVAPTPDQNDKVTQCNE